MEWVNRISDQFLNRSVVGIIDDIPIHLKNREEHGMHLRQVLQFERKDLYANPPKCEFWLKKVKC
jgi:hypothetical protein